MESKRSNKEPVLLPRYCKKIGITVMILAFATIFIVKAMNVEAVKTQKELFRVYILNAFILGLLFVAWSKDKIEDEMTLAIRLKSTVWAFTFAVVYVVIKPIIDLVFNDPMGNLTGQEVVMSMLIAFLIMYSLQKVSR